MGKIAAISSTTPTSSSTPADALRQPQRPSSFAELKDSLNAKPNWITTLAGGDLHQNLQRVREQILKGKAFGPRELLLFQMQASELNLRVELFAKVADSALSSIRRLQNSQ